MRHYHYETEVLKSFCTDWDELCETRAKRPKINENIYKLMMVNSEFSRKKLIKKTKPIGFAFDSCLELLQD